MLQVVRQGPKIKAQNRIEKHAAGYNLKNRFQTKFFHDLLDSRLCDTSNPLIKKKLGNPNALMWKKDINAFPEFIAVLLNECSFITISAAINLISVKLF